MKTCLALLLASVAGLGAIASAAVPARVTLNAALLRETPCGFVVDKVNVSQNLDVTRGDTLMTVRRVLGAPLQQLSPHVWTYTGFHASLPEGAEAYGCDTLVVTFSEDRVVDLKMVNLKATQVIAANLHRDNLATRVAKAAQ